MSHERLNDNLSRMLGELDEYYKKEGINVDDGQIAAAKNLASGVFLSHSTSSENFAKVCDSGLLLSPSRLDEEGIKPLADTAVERTLGTEGSVFLYATSFFFPNSGCGLLFRRSIEGEYSGGSATPFDSGGLVNIFDRPNNESPRAFFDDHKLPLSGYRDYLGKALSGMWSSPVDYLTGEEPEYAGPIGLSGGDFRRCAYEVRLGDELPVRNCRLQAVFLPKSLALVPDVESYVNWCLVEGFDVEFVDAKGRNDHSQLKKSCVKYLQKQLLLTS